MGKIHCEVISDCMKEYGGGEGNGKGTRESGVGGSKTGGHTVHLHGGLVRRGKKAEGGAVK